MQSTTQIHYGKKFYHDKKAGYWLSTTMPHVRAHRWVWQHHFGIIPKGYQIHHKDGDKSNNSIENLCLVTAKDHYRFHASPERSEKARRMAEKYRPLTKKWHKSEEGHLWHKYHALKNKFGDHPFRLEKCTHCNQEYKTKKAARTFFCSNKCKSASRRKHKLDNEERICKKCGIIFIVNKYSDTKTCGRSCAAIMRWDQRRMVIS